MFRVSRKSQNYTFFSFVCCCQPTSMVCSTFFFSFFFSMIDVDTCTGCRYVGMCLVFTHITEHKQVCVDVYECVLSVDCVMFLMVCCLCLPSTFFFSNIFYFCSIFSFEENLIKNFSMRNEKDTLFSKNSYKLFVHKRRQRRCCFCWCCNAAVVVDVVFVGNGSGGCIHTFRYSFKYICRFYFSVGIKFAGVQEYVKQFEDSKL